MSSSTSPEVPISLRAPDPTLAALARRAAAGDDDAFEGLYQRLDGGLRRFLFRRGVTADQIDELGQLAWVDVWQALRSGRYDPARAALTTFLYAVAYKVWLQHRREQRSAALHLTDDTQLAQVPEPNASDPADEIDLAEQIQRICDCLRSDSAESGISIEELAVVQGLSFGESERTLATQLGLAASTIHARKSSAFQKIRDYLAAAPTRPPAAERGPRPGG